MAFQLRLIKITCIHMVLNPLMPQKTPATIRMNFKSIIVLAGGFNPETAEQALTNGTADLVAFGRAFLSNFDERIKTGAGLNQIDFKTLYYS
jgi:N-ethylmaleimide reductase